MYKVYNIDESKKEGKSETKDKDLKTSFENLGFDVFKDLKRRDKIFSRKSKRKPKEKKGKVTSDEGFEDVDGKLNDSDTTIESTSTTLVRSDSVRSVSKYRNPFHGYLFKEDIETLKKAYENEKNCSEVKNSTLDFSGDSFQSNLNLSCDKIKVCKNGTKEPNNCECDCYKTEEGTRLKNFEDETVTFSKAKEDFKRQMNFTGMIYRLE